MWSGGDEPTVSSDRLYSAQCKQGTSAHSANRANSAHWSPTTSCTVQSIAIELVQLACTKLCSSPELGSRTPPPSFLPCYSCWEAVVGSTAPCLVPPHLVKFHCTLSSSTAPLLVPRCWFHRMNFDAVNSLLAEIVARAIESAIHEMFT